MAFSILAVSEPIPTANYITGCFISSNTVSPLSITDISTGSVRDDADTIFITPTVVTSPDITVSGENGLDTGAVAASTLYSMWLIMKADLTIAGLYSLSATTPTLPATYVHKRRVGWVLTTSTSNIHGFHQAPVIGGDRRLTYTFTFADAQFQMQAIGQSTVNAFTTISPATIIPETALSYWVRLSTQQTSSSLFTNVFVIPQGYGGEGWVLNAGFNDADDMRLTNFLGPMPVADQSDRRLQYRNTEAAMFTDIRIYDYIDSI